MAALSYRIFFCFSICLLGFSSSQAAEFYVSTIGDDNNPGTLSQRLRLSTVANRRPRRVIRCGIRGGVYDYVAGQVQRVRRAVRQSGTPGNRINYWAYPGETPVFDFFQYQPVETHSRLQRAIRLLALQRLRTAWCAASHH